MKPGSRASPVIRTACPACGALLDKRCAREFHPAWTAAAPSAR